MCLAKWYRCVWHASQHQYCGWNFLIPFSKQCWNSAFLRHIINWAKELPCKPRTGGKHPIWHSYYRMRTKDYVLIAHTSYKAFMSQFFTFPRAKDVAGGFWDMQHPAPSQLQLTSAKFSSHLICFALTWWWWLSRYYLQYYFRVSGRGPNGWGRTVLHFLANPSVKGLDLEVFRRKWWSPAKLWSSQELSPQEWWPVFDVLFSSLSVFLRQWRQQELPLPLGLNVP